MTPASEQPDVPPVAPLPAQTLLNISVPGGDGTAPSPPTRSTSVRATEAGQRTLGRYRVVREHARGGMGRVLLAIDTTIGRNVAVKELLAGAAADTRDEAATRSIGERFLREARVTGRLEHPNIVPVYEIGTSETGALYYSMRFVGGRTMAQKLDAIAAGQGDARARLAARLTLLEAFGDVCNAVAYAHSKGVIHRDLKPANVMLGEFGETVVLDWGLARNLAEENVGQLAWSGGDQASSQLTLDGTVVGTPAYMPPEQAGGRHAEVDELSDVYALGAVLYEILTGVPPYEGKSAHAVLDMVVSQAPPPVQSVEPLVPRELAVLCARAMERERSRRLPSALALATEIKAFRDGKALATYEYSSLELLQRFVRRHWKFLTLAACALFAVGVVSAYAIQEVVSERNAARAALARAKAEEDRRVQAERDLLDSRAAAIERLEQSLAGFDSEPLLRDLFLRVEGYRREAQALRSLDSNERARNRALITAVLAHAATLQELHRLQGASGPPGRLEDLRRIQSAVIELAMFDGDFELADYLLSSSNLPDADMAGLARRNADTRQARLQARRERLQQCLADAKLGLRRAERPPQAPSLAQYVAELAAFEDRQTVDVLAGELTALRQRLSAPGFRPGVIEFDLAELLCGGLGGLQQPLATVPILCEFLIAQQHPRFVAAAAGALARTQHRHGTLALAQAASLRGLRFIEDNRRALASAYLPPAFETDQPGAAALVLLARGEARRAASLLRAAPKDSAGRLWLALALQDGGERDSALGELSSLVRDEPDHLQGLLALARLQDDNEAALTLNRAVSAHPSSVDALVQRCMFFFERDFVRALADADAALALAPGRADLLRLKGDVLRVMSRLEESVATYNLAIEADPDNALAWIFKAEMLRALDKEFLPAALRAVELAPENSHAWAYLCQAYYFKVQLPQAVEAGRRSVSLNEREQEGWYYLALSHLRMRVDGSIGYDTFNARAANETERGYIAQAADAFRGLLRVNDRDFRSWALLGDCLLALGEDPAAREAFTRALSVSFLDCNTTGMGTLHVRRRLQLLDARAQGATEPQGTSQWLNRALSEAFAASHECEPVPLRSRLRRAFDCLDRASTGQGLDRPDAALARSARSELVRAMAEAGYFAEIPAMIEPALVNEPDWLVFRLEFALCEALVATGLQYRDGVCQYVGRDDAERERLLLEFDALTGSERKRRGEEMISRGFQRLQALAARGFDHHDLGMTPPMHPLAPDPRFAPVREAFRRSRLEARPVHPYAVIVIQGVRPGTQAAKLGLRQFDVVDSVDGRPIRTLTELRAAIASGRETYQLTVRRYLRNADGSPRMRVDSGGRAIVDERGNPVAEFELLRFEPKSGTLGVNLEQGYLPHPLDS